MACAKGYIRVRGAIWKHSSKRKGYGRSVGSFDVYKGDRHFFLTSLSTGKKRRYESPQAAKNDGWSKE